LWNIWLGELGNSGLGRFRGPAAVRIRIKAVPAAKPNQGQSRPIKANPKKIFPREHRRTFLLIELIDSIHVFHKALGVLDALGASRFRSERNP
jgi:hypothetical protein